MSENDAHDFDDGIEFVDDLIRRDEPVGKKMSLVQSVSWMEGEGALPGSFSSSRRGRNARCGSLQLP